MIEIALDEQPDNRFLGLERPVFTVNAFSGVVLNDYRRLARNFVVRYADVPIVIVRSSVEGFSLNMFALALFIESCHIENRIDCAVFKVADAAKATEAYKPYVALTIAIKYIMRLCRESSKNIYKEIIGLGYLGLDVKTDYAARKIYLSLAGGENPVKLDTTGSDAVLAAAGTLKALSLMNCGASACGQKPAADWTTPAAASRAVQSSYARHNKQIRQNQSHISDTAVQTNSGSPAARPDQ